jgi:small-conductance mechanosensitive channel
MEQGFAPKLSRVAAGISFLLFLGLLQYFFCSRAMLAVLFLPVLVWLLLTVTLPDSSRKKRIINLVANSLDVGDFFMERLDDRLEGFVKRLRR